MIPCRETPQGILLSRSEEFEPSQILDCGQCFRWDPDPDGGWTGIAMDRRLRLSPQPEGWLFEDVRIDEFERIWIPYFDLDRDYGAIRADLSARHEILAKAAAFAPGIRILCQDPWEALCSFIISQNNNIPRIKGILERLCALLGAEIPGGGRAFPTAERLAACTAEMLAPVRAGFRAKYVIDAAQRVASGALDLEQVRAMPLDEARSALQTVRGVGPKVADCALLYGLHRTECFPLDVWMKRAMALLPGVSPADFGENAGVAQQYIFHYARMHPALFERETAVS